MKKKVILILGGLCVILLVLAVGIGVGYSYGILQKDDDNEVCVVDPNTNTDDPSDNNVNPVVPSYDQPCQLKSCEYKNETWGISFIYPAGWYIEENDFGDLIIATDGFYRWELWADPVFTGGGTGYWIDLTTFDPSVVISTDSPSENWEVYPASYEGYMVTNYIKGSLIPDDYELDKDDNKLYWNWSNFTMDLDEIYTGGFGSGEMYDEISYNFFSIRYSHKSAVYHADDTATYYLSPEKDSEELENAFILMDGITSSVELKE